MTHPEAPARSARIGFWAGLLVGLPLILFSTELPAPEGLSPAALRTLGVTAIVALWWVSEALPLGATSLLPAAAFPLLDIAPAKVVAPAYASPFVLLLLGGFMLALAVERSGAHHRLALYVLLLVGTTPTRLVLGFAAAAAALSMWISNTASTLMMMPIALAIVQRAEAVDRAAAERFALSVLLATAYGASIGGMGTPIGTPPNVIAIGALKLHFPDGPELTFLTWFMVALPIVVVLVPLMWWLLTRVVIRVDDNLDLGAEPVLRRDLAALGPVKNSEKRSLAVFAVAALLWVTQSDVVIGDLTLAGWASRFGVPGTDEGTVAILAALLAFMVPGGDPEGTRLLPWSTAVKVPWDLVLLFGGGIALAKGFDATGLSGWLGDMLAGFKDTPEPLFMGLTVLAITYFTEFMSNTALSNIAMPILASAAKSMTIDPRVLLFPAALACSCAFMMPAATGPNAIVFGTGRIRIAQMVRVGFWVNLAAALIVSLVSWLTFGG